MDFDLAAEIDAPDRLVAYHLVRTAFGDLLAQIHGQHAVDERRHALDVVIDEQHGAAVPTEAVDQLGKISDLAGREPGEWLIDQHHLRIARHRPSELQATQIGEGQGGGMTVQHSAEPDPAGDLARPLLNARRRGEPQQRIGQQRELDVLEHGLAVQGAGMLEHDADTLPRDAVRGPARHVHPFEHDLAGIGFLDAHDQLHDGGLARSVRPDQAENFPWADLEADVLHRDQPAETLADMLDLDQRSGVGFQSRSPLRSA